MTPPLTNTPNNEPNDDDLDLRMRNDLLNIALPIGGMEAVRSAVQVAQGELRHPLTTVVSVNFTRRRWFKISAAAAACAVGGGCFFQRRSRQFDRGQGAADSMNFLADAVAKARATILLAHKATAWDDLGSYLTSHTVPTSALAAQKLHPLRPRGCQQYDWKGGQAGLTCYSQTDGSLVHIFTLQRGQLHDGAQLATTVAPVTEQNGRECSFWAEAGTFCVLVAGKDGVSLSESLHLLNA